MKKHRKNRGKRRKRQGRKRRTKKKRRGFTRVVVTYVLELDAIFEVTATPSRVGEKTAFMDGHLGDIASSGLFKRFIGDKLYDSEDIIVALEEAGIEPCIPAREGKLKPKNGARIRADENYKRLREQEGNLRSLVESCYSSLKSLYTDYLRSRKQKGKEVEVLMLALAYNVLRLSELGLI